MKQLIRKFALWLLSWTDACPTCGAAWADHSCPKTAKLTGRVCGVCGRQLTLDAVKTHHGKWRCKEHKVD
jgi:hypothetical protein